MRLSLAGVLAACTHAATPSTPATSAPPIDDAQVALPAVDEFALGNGIRVLLVENHRVPLVAVTVMHRAAGSRGDGGHAGLAALTLAALDRGAGAQSADELADALERAGARLELDIATDYAATRLVALASGLSAGLDVVATMIRRPHLHDDDIAKLRAARVAELAQHRARPRTVAAQLFDRVAFGDHPYALPAEGLPARVAALTGDEVRAFWRRGYGPGATTIVVAGDTTKDALAGELERAFGDWRGDALPPRAPLLPDAAVELAYVVAPGAAQTIALVGRRVVPAGVDVELAADVANHVLGVGDDSRLTRELGASASAVSSSFWRGEWSATWTIAATLRGDRTASAIHALFAQLAVMRGDAVTDAELAAARTALARGLAQTFDTAASSARALERLVVRRLPADYFATYGEHLARITPAQVTSAIVDRWASLSFVIVGDLSHVAELEREIGRAVPIALYDLDGKPLR